MMVEWAGMNAHYWVKVQSQSKRAIRKKPLSRKLENGMPILFSLGGANSAALSRGSGLVVFRRRWSQMRIVR